jgi:hypothetical protein
MVVVCGHARPGTGCDRDGRDNVGCVWSRFPKRRLGELGGIALETRFDLRPPENANLSRYFDSAPIASSAGRAITATHADDHSR